MFRILLIFLTLLATTYRFLGCHRTRLPWAGRQAKEKLSKTSLNASVKGLVITGPWWLHFDQELCVCAYYLVKGWPMASPLDLCFVFVPGPLPCSPCSGAWEQERISIWTIADFAQNSYNIIPGYKFLQIKAIFHRSFIFQEYKIKPHFNVLFWLKSVCIKIWLFGTYIVYLE